MEALLETAEAHLVRVKQREARRACGRVCKRVKAAFIPQGVLNSRFALCFDRRTVLFVDGKPLVFVGPQRRET